MRFGYHHSAFVGNGEKAPFQAVLDRARRVEAAGFDLITFMDHVWQLPHNGQRDDPFFDCYTTLPAVAAVTDRIELSALVTCVGYRNPSLLAKMLATLDHASDGRAVLGIGAGWYEAEYDAYGYEFPEPATRVHQLRDAVRIAKAMWTEEPPVSFEGDHYAVEDAILEPKPVQDPHPPVMVGGGGEQLTLHVAAEHADRWNVPMADPETYEHKLSVLADHCETVGRDYDEIEKTVLTFALLREDGEAAHEAYEELASKSESGPVPRDEYRGMVGTPEGAIELAETFGDLGVEMVMTAVPRNDEETIDRLADEVLPALA